jgi:hypothetical protein
VRTLSYSRSLPVAPFFHGLKANTLGLRMLWTAFKRVQP